jgi:hypothetical protein
MTGPTAASPPTCRRAQVYDDADETSAGSGYTMHQYLLEQGPVAYVIQTAVYPADVNVSNHRANLQGGLDNAAKNMEGGKWASIGWVTHQGLTGVDAIGVRGEHAIRSFSVMKGRQIVTLTYAGPAGLGPVARRRPVRRLSARRPLGRLTGEARSAAAHLPRRIAVVGGELAVLDRRLGAIDLAVGDGPDAAVHAHHQRELPGLRQPWEMHHELERAAEPHARLLDLVDILPVAEVALVRRLACASDGVAQVAVECRRRIGSLRPLLVEVGGSD